MLGSISEVHYTPIKALNTFTFDWKIKGRVTKKHPKRPWKNARTEGSVFNIEVMDNEATQIVGTFFNESAEKYYGELVEGQVYTFTGGSVKIANSKYTSVKNDYNIIFDRTTVIQLSEDDHKIKNQGFSFVTIEDINDFEQLRTVDFAGVIITVSSVSSFQPRSYDGSIRPPKDKRTLQLVD